MSTETLTWHVLAENAADLPDADTTVLIELDPASDYSEPTFLDFLDGVARRARRSGGRDRVGEYAERNKEMTMETKSVEGLTGFISAFLAAIKDCGYTPDQLRQAFVPFAAALLEAPAQPQHDAEWMKEAALKINRLILMSHVKGDENMAPEDRITDADIDALEANLLAHLSARPAPSAPVRNTVAWHPTCDIVMRADGEFTAQRLFTPRDTLYAGPVVPAIPEASRIDTGEPDTDTVHSVSGASSGTSTARARLYRTDTEALDECLRLMFPHLEPDVFRTDGGNINMPKVRSLWHEQPDMALMMLLAARFGVCVGKGLHGNAYVGRPGTKDVILTYTEGAGTLAATAELLAVIRAITITEHGATQASDPATSEPQADLVSPTVEGKP